MNKKLITIFIIILLSGFFIYTISNKKTNQENIEVKEIKNYLNKDDSWYTKKEAINIANIVVNNQNLDGGWKKDWQLFLNNHPTSNINYLINAYKETHEHINKKVCIPGLNLVINGRCYQAKIKSWDKSTIDNDYTTSEITFLAKMYQETKKVKYKNAALKGIKLLLIWQYDNGGYSQIFNDFDTYHADITFNDYAMSNVMILLQQIANKQEPFTFIDESLIKNVRVSLEKGIDCILKTQIEVNGIKSAWAQQYDKEQLIPIGGRIFEPAAISTKESIEIIKFLQSIPNPSKEINEAINSAIKWLNSVKITDTKFIYQNNDKVIIHVQNAPSIWARFYEIGTNKAIFADYDGTIYYDVSQISLERRLNYDWYGYWPNKLFKSGEIHV